MTAKGELEPTDSRRVTGTKPGKERPWHELEDVARGRGSEYEPEDSRNVTGTASTPSGRWTDDGRDTPDAEGRTRKRPTGDEPPATDPQRK
ncbi:hypothetical protein GCM10011371_20130 [Novosphingobium marinum]|uniref:Uncharacterized protein n=1 Tax=Novosphingobium marinum TaxID=1514948 RepID=A0A7Z0BW80_9SPHN|nr:hypothetical protein [Novosphingobium marinum]NYH96125.1 hypothetical protein [Novosphingobium marinum]GGC32675.1 hypothetical protein GCM10011371_20130 [Novosphingobium marinum]